MSTAQELSKDPRTGTAAETVVRMTGGERNSPMVSNPTLDIARTAKSVQPKKR